MIYLNGFLIWFGAMIALSIIVNGAKECYRIKYQHKRDDAPQALYFPDTSDE